MGMMDIPGITQVRVGPSLTSEEKMALEFVKITMLLKITLDFCAFCLSNICQVM